MLSSKVSIYLHNEIQLDNQIEVVDEIYPVEISSKKEILYLKYTNEEQEKVVLKVGTDSLVMTRFSRPNTIMRFINQSEAIVQLHTPIGIQQFRTQTSRYIYDKVAQSILLSYVLKPLESEQVFAQYEMKISWK